MITVASGSVGTKPAPRRGRAQIAHWSVVGALTVGLLVLIWTVLTWMSPGWIPSVSAIATAMGDLLTTSETWRDVWLTFTRICIAFAVATPVGVLIGFLMGMNRYAEGFFRPITIILLATPDPVYIIVVVLLLGVTETSSLLALSLAVAPFVVSIVHTNVNARDRALDDMSAVYRLSRGQYIAHVLSRQASPALVLACRTAFAFAWKGVVLVEALTQPEGVGAQIYYSFRFLRGDEMIAWTVLFIVMMRAIDALVFGMLERRLMRWSK